MKKIKNFLLVAFVMIMPSVGYAREQLIQGFENEQVLIASLGFGILVLFICLIVLTYLLARVLPGLMSQQQPTE